MQQEAPFGRSFPEQWRTKMPNSRHCGAVALALLASVSIAAAQEKASEVGQNPAAQTPSGAIPADNSGALTNPPTQATNAKPAEAPGSSSQGGPAASSAGAPLQPGGPPGATGQTMPSTRSAENAAEDKRIIVEHALNDQQKQKIAQVMATQMAASTTGSASNEDKSLTVGNTVPASVTMHEFPANVSEQMPEMKNYKYVQMADKLLVIEPNNRIVIGVISR
jgi:Protein of unknown function (DUF1236)